MMMAIVELGRVGLMTLGERAEVPKLFILFQQIAELFLEFIYLWKVYKLLEWGFISLFVLEIQLLLIS